MRIAYIVGLRQGIHRFIYQELEYMESQAHQLDLYTTKYNKGTYMPKQSWSVYSITQALLMSIQAVLFNPLRSAAVLYIGIRNRAFIDAILAIGYARIATRNKTELIHAHFGDHKLFIAYFMKRFTKIPLTVTIHAHELHRNPNPSLFRLALTECDSIITISSYNKQLLIEKWGADQKKITVIRLFAQQKTRLIRILVVGSFEPRKGYDTLIQALKKMRTTQYVVWVAGEGELDVPAMAKDAHLENKMVFFGKLHCDILDILYESCDIFCLPSQTVKVKGGYDVEGIPVALMEAMMAGKPVVTTHHAGIPELVDKILVPQGDAQQLANALDTLCDDAQLRKTIGKENQTKVKKHYSIQNASKLNKTFQEVVRCTRKES